MPRSTHSRIARFRPAVSIIVVVIVVALVSIVLGGVAGCQTQPAQPTPYTRKAPVAAGDGAGGGAKSTRQTGAPAISNTDPCAMRLHDICGALLLYYQQNHTLPKSLDELANSPLLEGSQALVCPVSKQPYLYNPVGITNAESRARLICYDPTPAHAGCRWAITITEPAQENGPLVTKVIGLPESHFTFMGR